MMAHILKQCFRCGRSPWTIAPVLAGILWGCSPLYVLDTLVPAGEYDLTSGISYGDLPRHQLDIYRPAKPIPSAPVIIFFYGGSWKNGERGQYRFVGEALTRRGYTVVVPDYRLYPDVTFPVAARRQRHHRPPVQHHRIRNGTARSGKYRSNPHLPGHRAFQDPAVYLRAV